ncbi:22039_t:CDS:1, partial [Gigaspora rosea]
MNDTDDKIDSKLDTTILTTNKSTNVVIRLKEHTDSNVFYSNLEVKKGILFNIEKESEKQRTTTKDYK